MKGLFSLSEVTSKSFWKQLSVWLLRFTLQTLYFDASFCKTLATLIWLVALSL